MYSPVPTRESGSWTEPPSWYHALLANRTLARWLFAIVLVGRLTMFVVLMQAYLMQQREISGIFHRDDFFWSVLASAAAEVCIDVVMQRVTLHNPLGRRILQARRFATLFAHLFTFVAFFRTDTALFARSESGYCGATIIVLLDVMFANEMNLMISNAI
jgi:hypothetical protein